MRFLGRKIRNKSKGPNSEITKDCGSLCLADVEILSYDLTGNSACSTDLFSKGAQTGVPYELEAHRGWGRETGGHLDFSFLDLWN